MFVITYILQVVEPFSLSLIHVTDGEVKVRLADAGVQHLHQQTGSRYRGGGRVHHHQRLARACQFSSLHRRVVVSLMARTSDVIK